MGTHMHIQINYKTPTHVLTNIHDTSCDRTKEYFGYTPLQRAHELGHSSIVKLFESMQGTFFVIYSHAHACKHHNYT